MVEAEHSESITVLVGGKHKLAAGIKLQTRNKVLQVQLIYNDRTDGSLTWKWRGHLPRV